MRKLKYILLIATVGLLMYLLQLKIPNLFFSIEENEVWNSARRLILAFTVSILFCGAIAAVWKKIGPYLSKLYKFRSHHW